MMTYQGCQNLLRTLGRGAIALATRSKHSLRCRSVCVGGWSNYTGFSRSITQTAVTAAAENIDVQEIEIPVPWGKIAARHWNGSDPSRKPVLCLHGWKDNAATFDSLFPLLVPELPDYQFLAIDLPGHGKSSHFPAGMVYSVQDIWVLIRRIYKYFDWKTISLIGHSMGAQLSFSYTGTHPNIVEKMIAIDGLSPVVLSKEETLGVIPTLTKATLSFEEKLASGERPSYSHDEILQKLVRTHIGQMGEDGCKVLMARGTVETPVGSGRYQFTHDIRVHYMPITGISEKQVHTIARNLKSDVLYIKASEGVNYTRPYIKSRMENWMSHEEDGTPKGNIVRFVEVTGKHHLHLTHPESVLPYIVRFMTDKRQVSKDEEISPLIIDA